jgi:hypothetical protein
MFAPEQITGNFSGISEPKMLLLFQSLTRNFKQIIKASKINKLKVGHKTYLDASVPETFYDSISHLKTKDFVSI